MGSSRKEDQKDGGALIHTLGRIESARLRIFELLAELVYEVFPLSALA